MVSGVIIIHYYDLTLDQVTTYTWSHIKSSYIATILFLGKIIRFFKGGGPRPPIEPNNDPIDLNHNLILPDAIVESAGYNTKVTLNKEELNKFFPNSNTSLTSKNVTFVDSIDKGKGPMV